jgi:hypothetical protein
MLLEQLNERTSLISASHLGANKEFKTEHFFHNDYFGPTDPRTLTARSCIAKLSGLRAPGCFDARPDPQPSTFVRADAGKPSAGDAEAAGRARRTDS